MRSFTVALISTLLLSPVSVLSTYHETDSDRSIHHENNADLDHSKSSTRSKDLTVSIKILYDGEDAVKTCRVEKSDDEEDEEDDEEEEKEKEEKKGKKKEKKKGKDYADICLGGINPNDGFKCKKRFIELKKVLSRAKSACKGLKSKRNHKIRLYTASDFKAAPGPYLEYRIYNKYLNFGLKQQYRLVMTKTCAVVGAVVRNKDTSYTTCKFGPK
ncbi:putative secreted effector protein [Golovinomyces cichoracearum]|uniref:Putative secreted effector protein n=1 Tax=Golovinomyces cichoracearum TaxID=62708 RepID=A0A420J898_9PEZI|nr:putative secreted effector protein [Golovinomyces cichoracearum]